MASPGLRAGLTHADRDQHAARTPLPPLAGSLAGKANKHRFRSMTLGLGGGQCADCFGWVDDTRHTYPKVMVLNG